MSMDFVAIDVETANPDMASICQIGLVSISDGELVSEHETYIDPKTYFDPINVSIHGITHSDVQGAPSFLEIHEELRSRMNGNVVVCHTHFDRVSIHQAASRHQVPEPDVTWLDSAKVARRTWEQCAWKGYGLSNVCEMLGYSFNHHNALEDAKAAAHILISASRYTGLDIAGLLRRVKQPIVAGEHPHSSHKVAKDGNSEGELYGEKMVFTGALSIPRREAADLAASLGIRVTTSVTSKTTMLVVGDQDITKLAGHKKSSKHRKAEKLIENGSAIRVLRESDFRKLVDLSGS